MVDEAEALCEPRRVIYEARATTNRAQAALIRRYQLDYWLTNVAPLTTCDICAINSVNEGLVLPVIPSNSRAGDAAIITGLDIVEPQDTMICSRDYSGIVGGLTQPTFVRMTVDCLSIPYFGVISRAWGCWHVSLRLVSNLLSLVDCALLAMK